MRVDGVILTPLTVREDGRGWLTEVWRADESMHTPAMGYVSLTQPGITRGPHEHREQADFFVFLTSQWWVVLWDHRSGEVTEALYFEIEQPSSLLVPPGVIHAYGNVGDEDGLVLNGLNQ